MYSQHKQSTVAHANYINDRTPTLFLHGTSGNLNSLKYIINEAEDRGVTQDVMIAHVSKDGAVTFEGALAQQARNPIVQIELEDNDNMDLNKNASWIKNVIVALDQKQHFKHFNFVGHSMGNTSFAQYMLNYGNDTSLPQLKHQVSIAGTYNGVLGMNEDVNEISVDNAGKPSRMIAPYEGFMKLKPMYKGKNIEVLNIYGDILDGTHSDGIVSMSSSKSLKYLLVIALKVTKNRNMRVLTRNIATFTTIQKLPMKSFHFYGENKNALIESVRFFRFKRRNHFDHIFMNDKVCQMVIGCGFAINDNQVAVIKLRYKSSSRLNHE